MLVAETLMAKGAERPIDLIVVEQNQTISPLVKAAIAAIEGVRMVERVSSFPHLQGADDVWPSWDQVVVRAHEIDTTLRIQQIYRSSGRLPRLIMKDAVRQEARRLLAEVAGMAQVIVVHLKNRPDLVRQSNAQHTVWRDFLSRRNESHFVLIGHDPVPDEIAGLANVTVLAKITSGLEIHLACISEATGFLGMQSGPANFAIFSDTPYVLFKNPTHHTTEMVQEIGADDHYVFATPRQRIWRQWESVALLNRATDLILGGR